MKNTKRIHENRNAARPSPQVKTSRNHQPENVRILITDEAGESCADFKISKAICDAMFHDVIINGINLGEWIENAVRERIKKLQSKLQEVAS